jgi:hypothetical protein
MPARARAAGSARRSWRSWRGDRSVSYLDKPTWSGDILVGALLSMGAASATAVGLFFLAMLAIEPLVITYGFLGVFVGFFIGMWFALVALLLFGAPGTFLLRRLGAESLQAYGALGALAGVGASLIVLRDAPNSFWFHVDALVSGAVGGIVWWRSYRQHFQDSEISRA